MTLLVDTSVWSLALRRDGSTSAPEVRVHREALAGSDSVVTTGLILQELPQDFNGPRSAAAIVERFQALPIIALDRSDHTAAAEVPSSGRRAGVQVGPIDTLLIQLCGRNELILLSTDNDFVSTAQHVPFKHWRP